MVYVISKNGQPLMPTVRYGKVRKLLNSNRAIVIRCCPFTIQLLYDTEEIIRPVDVGIDAGTKHIGISACTDTQELYSSEVLNRSDIVKLLSQRRELRRTRRHRKTRYRKVRFSNRIHSKHKGWLAPSMENIIQTHIRELELARSILPVRKITIETAQFDTQLLKAITLGLPLPEGVDCQQGEQYGFWNTREYILWRDNHTCQCCHGKSGDKILNVHHIESRQTGGDSPDNLVTLCETCHQAYHQGKIQLPASVRKHRPLKDATKMEVMRWTLYNRLKAMLLPEGIELHMTYGYLTKHIRIEYGLEKSHRTDARCISGHPDVQPSKEYFLRKKVRCHNRQIHKLSIGKHGCRKKNQSAYDIQGFHLFDKVRYGEHTCFIFGKRTSGYFDIRHLDGEKIHACISYKKLRLIESARYTLIERRANSSPTCFAEVGVSFANT